MSFPRYPEYKDSGVDWLGEVPAHWPVVRLRDIAGFAGGATPSRDNPSYWGGDLPWVSPKDMKVESICATEELITEEGLANCAATLQAPGRVLLVVRSGILKHTIPVAINQVPVVLNQDMKSLHFRPGTCESRFFLRWVQGLNDSLLLAWSKQGVTVESIEHAYLASTPLPLPPTTEQQAIVSFLDRETAKIDALIAEQQRLIALLSEKRQAVISHAVTKGLNPDVPMKDSGVEWLGEVPAHWEVTRVGNLFIEVSESGETDLPVLSVSIHHGVSDRELGEQELDRKVSRSEDRTKYKRVRPGDLVYNMMRAWQGAFGAVAVDGMVSPAYVVARPRQRVSTFVELLLRTPKAIEEMRRFSNGVTDFRLRLYWPEFKNIRITLPPPQEMEAICDYANRVSAEFSALIEASNESVMLLNERRTALISAAVTGKIDVRGLADIKTTSPEARDVEPA